MLRLYGCVIGCALAALSTGCGKPPPPPIVPAGGTVTLNGRPLPKAQVRFVPMIDHGAEFTAVGETDANGRFVLKSGGQEGACACEHIVVIAEAPIPEKLLSESAQAELAKYLKALPNRPIPEKYGVLMGSGLNITVTAGQAEYNFDLVR